MGLNILVYLATVDIEVDNFSLLSVSLQITGYTVGKAHTDGNEHVALLFLQIDGIVAIERMVGRQC